MMKSISPALYGLLLLAGLLGILACTGEPGTQDVIMPEPTTHNTGSVELSTAEVPPEVDAPSSVAGRTVMDMPALSPGHDYSPRDVRDFTMFKPESTEGMRRFRSDERPGPVNGFARP